MSSTLYWAPIPDGKYLPDELKRILSKAFSLPRVFTFSDIPYLEGLRDAEIKGASELIDHIRKYEEVKVWECY